MSLRWVRSPPAPKITITQGSPGLPTVCVVASARLETLISTVLLRPTSSLTSPRLICGHRFGLHMPAELLPHGRQNFFGEGMLLARAEPSVKCRRQHFGGHSLVDRSHDRPPPLPRVLHYTGVVREVAVFRPGHRRKVQQPRTDDAAPAPQFCDIRIVEVIAVFLRERCAVGVLEDVETFRIGLHESVFDSVVNHFDEV